ncbi:hypothetical protein CYFUS_007247 [Cystobacter fuscus]|uniref:Uncharacterized protein n=1 Tax=Cystobacter fuscus TaxID=43 RepID=A0A250JE41_9BACT|nr:hypothetical protein [Cystobacter fuscus]ATB41777.1 hypothetical protein CYFUS_007247 [Cystobacter fuscus]
MLQDEQFEVDRELGRAVLARMPQGWHAVTLRAECKPGAGDKESYQLSFETAPGVPGSMVADESMEFAVRKLFLLHRRYATGLKVATYLFRQRPDERWAWSADYEYED